MNPELQAVIEYLSGLKYDVDVGKRFKEETRQIITILNEPSPRWCRFPF